MLEWARRQLNARHDRQLAYQRRVDRLSSIAQELLIPNVLEHVQVDILDLKPGLSPSSDLDWIEGPYDSYNIKAGVIHRRRGLTNKEPLFVGSIQRTTIGKTWARHVDTPHRYRFEVNEYELVITENGEIRGRYRYEDPVTLGTIRTIGSLEDLQTAVDRHLARKKG